MNIQYTEKWKRASILSAVILLVGIIMGIVAGGMNLGVDFTGGTLVTIDMKSSFDIQVIETALRSNQVKDAQVLRSGESAAIQTYAIIRMKENGAQEKLPEQVLQTIQQTYANAEILSAEHVNGVADMRLLTNAFLCLLLIIALAFLYFWVRMGLLAGCAAIIALLHDVACMLAFACILRIAINRTFLAAVYIVVCVSLYFSVLLLGHVRELSKKERHADKHRAELVNKGIHSTLTRSLSISGILLLLVLAFLALGTSGMRRFALPILIGLLAATYSSIFLTAPIWERLHALQAGQQKGTSKKKKK